MKESSSMSKKRKKNEKSEDLTIQWSQENATVKYEKNKKILNYENNQRKKFNQEVQVKGNTLIWQFLVFFEKKNNIIGWLKIMPAWSW